MGRKKQEPAHPGAEKMRRMLMGRSEFEEHFSSLKEKHEYLVAKSELRRREIAAAFDNCAPALRAADKAYQAATFIKRNPLVVTLGMAVAGKVVSTLFFRGRKKRAKQKQRQKAGSGAWLAAVPIWVGRAMLVFRVAMQIRRGIKRGF